MYSDLQMQAYRALSKAAERIGHNGYMAEVKRRKMTLYEASTYHLRRRTNRGQGIYTPTDEHKRVIKAMSQVLSGEISPEEAIALLHDYEILHARL